MSNTNWVSLHTHTTKSLLDGANKIEDYVDRVKELGMTSCAITDHNHIGGWIEFMDACNNQEIKSIYGCCLPHQPIFTSRGIKEIKDIKVGDLVLTHEGRYKKVLRHWDRDFDGKLYGIESWNTNTVWLTDEHPVYVKKTIKTPGKLEYEQSMQWIRADEIKPCKDRWRYSSTDQRRIWEYYSVIPKIRENACSVINLEDFLDKDRYYACDGLIERVRQNKYDTVSIKPVKSRLEITNELMKFIGYFLAEGSYISSNGAVKGLNFTFNINEEDYINEVVQLTYDIFGFECTTNYRQSKHTCDICISSVVLADFFVAFLGKGCKEKFIPNILLRQDLGKQEFLLQGIINGDGKITDKEVYIKLANKDMIYDIKQLLANLGYSSAINKIKDKEHYGLRYTIDKTRKRYYHEDDEYIYMPIKNVDTKHYSGKVYNFEVEDDNSYVTDITLHNCEMYQTWDMNIITMDAKARRELAIKSATEAGVVIPDKINKKKITQKQIDEYIKDFVYDTKQYHLIVLAMNQTGLQNLIKLQSEAADKGLYNGRYCCDFSLLEKYNEGLIVTSACLGGMIPNLIIKNREEEAYMIAEKYKSIFGDRFYIEIQPLLDPEQSKANEVLIRFAKELDVSLVATNDVHYTYKEDHEDHDTLLCVGIGKKKSDPDRMRYPHEFWLRSYDEMIEAFKRHDNYDKYKEEFLIALNNTNVIADRIESGLTMGSPVPLFPKVNVPRGMTPESYLTVRSYTNLYKYLAKNPYLNRITYQKRLIEELDIINTKGFAPYMLSVFEIVDHCKEVDIPVGPGRGSASGSLVLFVNGGTKVADPIKYDLLFFRFLTIDRKDPPDVDTDFSYYGRPKLIKWLEEKHGQANVCNIGTWTELGVKSGLKDFGRVLDIDFLALNNLCKQIDEITDEVPGFKFKDFEKFLVKAEEAKEEGDITTHDKYVAKYNAYSKLKEEHAELFRIAIKFEGTPRNFGCHASGVLVMPCPVNDYLPTRCDKDGNRITLLTGPQVERLNIIKLDILGLKTLDVLDKTVKQIDPKATVEDLYDLIPEYLEDKAMFSQLLNKETEGLFQIESNMFKGLCEDMMVSNFNDVCATLSIGRPGPLSAGMHTAYANRKKGIEEAVEVLRGTGHITKDTFHTIIYQEQCMLIAQHVAKFDDSQSDSIIRKALAKKKKDMMELARRSFIYGKLNMEDPEPNSTNTNRPYYDAKSKYGAPILGGTNNGWSEEELTEFWETLKGYASYLFNKSHSQSYSVVTLLTMYLKCNFKSQFFASLLSMQSTADKVDLYSKTARDYGIYTAVPDINNSSYDFTEHEGRILYGFKSIKGIGDGPIEELIANRPYSSLQDIFDKVPKKAFNKKVGVALIKSGALDSFNTNRYELLNEFMDIRKDKDDRYSPIAYDENVCMEFEKEVLSTCITYVPWIDTILDGDKFEQEFELVSCSERTDKNGNMMGFPKLKIQGSIIDAIVFSRTYCNNVQAFDVDRTASLVVKGKKDGQKLIISKVIQTTSHEELNILEDIVL